MKEDWIAAAGGAGVATAIGCAARVVGPQLEAWSAPWSAPVVALGAAVALGIVGWRAPRLAHGAAFASALFLGGNVLFSAMTAASEPLATMLSNSHTEPPHQITVTTFVPFVILGLATVPFLVAATVVARGWPRAWLGIGATIAVVAAVLTLRGAATLGRPARDDYLSLFRDTAPLDWGQHVTVDSTRFDYVPVADFAKRPGSGIGPDGRTVHTTPDGDMCILQASTDDEEPRSLVFARSASIDALAKGCPKLTLARDPDSGFAVALLRGGTSSPHEPLAIMWRATAMTNIDFHALHGRIGAPREWVACGLLGLLAACVALGLALRDLGRTRRLDEAVEAIHLGDGWVLLDGVRRHVAGLETAKPGAVALRLEPVAPGPTYRDDGRPGATLIGRGTPQLLRHAILENVVARASIAAVVAAITAAPLLAAWMYGLL